MQLYRLRLRAIGPFAGEHEVDFERLGSSGLFLLEGPTGSGKSTVIDAVVFALYGKVAGSDASDDRMHSDFAEPGVEPFVELDFATSSGLYRIRRTPKFERPKARGHGTTTQNATARLWRLTSPDAGPDDDAVATSVAEVGSEVMRVVGLSREQLVKTVVLPQGEFAAFLRAPAEERRELLQRLFGTEVFERVQRRLEEQRRAAADQRAVATAVVRDAVAAFSGAVGLSDEEQEAIGSGAEEPGTLLAALDRLVSGLAAEVESSTADQQVAQAAADAARDRLAAARKREQQRQEKDLLLARRASLAEAEALVGGLRQRLAEARRAEGVRAVLEGRRVAEARVAAAEAALDEARAGLRAESTVEPTAWPAAERARRGEAERLTPLAQLEAELPAREHEVAETAARRSALAARLDDVRQALAELPDRLTGLRAGEEQARVAAASRQAASESVVAAEARLGAARLVARLGSELRDTESAVVVAADRASAAQAEESRLRQGHIEAMAGHLASTLEPGAPCPVCGSTEHPAAAELAVDAVGPADVEAAETQRKAAMEALDQLAAERNRLTTQLAAAEASAVGLDEAAARDALLAARTALDLAEEAGRRHAQLRLEREEAEKEQAALVAERTELAAQHGAAVALVDTLSASLATDRERVAEGRGGDASIAARCRRLTEEADVLAGLVRLAAQADGARTDLDLRMKESEDVAVRHGFADAGAAAAALLGEDELGDLTRRVDAHDREVTEVDLSLAEPQLATLDVTEVHDLMPLVAADAEATLAAQQAQAACTRAGLQHTSARVRREAVAEALTRRARIAHETTPVIRMANLASANTADNALTMTLPTFVLLERFRDVVAAANQRLTVMSDGRYGLEHVVDKEGGRRSGLGLLVVDNHTDKPRNPKTLSGGETFYCSLALALGLADVVTAEAGGIDLGTLFVDEGFGTLDPDTLEQVISVLSGLRSGGRTVGIVSHVAELRERISERIEVRRNADGSSRLEVVA